MVFFRRDLFMHYQDILALVFVIVFAGALFAWIIFQAGRLNGFRSGVEEGAKRASKTQHLRGMTDGYVMALQHTPGQRDEYMRNVLLKIGAVTEADVSKERERRLARQALLEAE